MKTLKVAVLVITLVLGGCVAGTRNIAINPPEYSNEVTASGPVYINTINDKRQFEQKPRFPSTPSVDGDLSKTSKDTLSTLIGRQRNGFGAAMGDVALEKGVTVQDKVRELLTKGLESRGYRVSNDINSSKKISADIEKFWAWFSPGMWSVSFESDIRLVMNLEDGSKRETITANGYGINRGQVASNANWELTFQRAYLDFLNNLDKLLDEAGW